MRLRIVIAGAGIGGLAVAIALRQRGLDPIVLERTPGIRPVGAGLALQPNAMVALRVLGLEREVLSRGAEQSSAALRDERGRPLGPLVDFRPLYTSLGATTVALHRARLHQVLVDALGPAALHLGVAVTAYEPSPRGVRVHTSGGDTIDADLLVGADGLHSSVRAQMVKDGPPRYAGYTSWRGVTAAGAMAAVPCMTESWGRGLRFGLVNIGFGETYWFAVANAPPEGRDLDVREELAARFGNWHEPIAHAIACTPAEQIVRTDIADRAPLTRWHEGCAVLLGDAAHPMTPNLGQGAGQAIEDAVVLAEALATVQPIEAALRQYAARRLARANAIVVASRRFGAVSQWQHPAAVCVRNAVVRLTPAALQLRQARALMRSSLNAAT